MTSRSQAKKEKVSPKRTALSKRGRAQLLVAHAYAKKIVGEMLLTRAGADLSFPTNDEVKEWYERALVYYFYTEQREHEFRSWTPKKPFPIQSLPPGTVMQ